MKCELCPIQAHCPAYQKAYENNENSYHRQEVVRVDEYDEPSCPLVKLIKKQGRK